MEGKPLNSVGYRRDKSDGGVKSILCSRRTSSRDSKRDQLGTGWLSDALVVGRRRDAVFQSRQPPVRPSSSDPHGTLFEESILLRAGTIIRNPRGRQRRKAIDYLLLRDPESTSRKRRRRLREEVEEEAKWNGLREEFVVR